MRFRILIALLAPPVLALTASAGDKREFDINGYLKGRHIFQSQCSPCHGMRGRGDGPWAEGLPDQPRNFRVGIFKFRTTPIGFLPTEDDLSRTIRAGISGTAMPSFKDRFRDDDIEALIVYLQSMSPRWDDENCYAEAAELPEKPEWFRGGARQAEEGAKGAVLFAQLCAACHGETGKGDGPGAVALVDVWEHPVKPADLTKPHHKSGDRPEDLYRTIAMGLDGTPMLGFGLALKEEQIWELVAFIKNGELAD